MTINLIYNESAGDGSHSMAAIVKRLEDQGTNVRAINRNSADLNHFLTLKCDLLLIAGGDGTVQEVLKKMIKRPLPFAILPLGNANNMAESLNLEDYLGKIKRNWRAGKTTPLSMGYLEKQGKRTIFRIGRLGAVCRYAGEHQAREKQQTDVPEKQREDKVAFGLENLKGSLSAVHASHYQIQLDGRDFSGDYVWIEVMNTSYMGPNLYLAPEATTADAYLDVILIKKEEKGKVARFIKHQQQKNHDAFEVAIKAREVLIKGAGTLHVDDEVLEYRPESVPRQNWVKLGLYPEKFWLVPSY